MSAPLEPVGPEDLAALRELEAVRINLAVRLLGLEQEKVRVLAADRRVQGEQDGLIRRIASERGLGNALVEINPKTGAVEVMTNDDDQKGTNGTQGETADP